MELTDFVEVKFASAVIPTEVTIFETYYPGAIVRILAYPSHRSGSSTSLDAPDDRHWVELYRGPPDRHQLIDSRAFSPPLRRVNFSTNHLRIEFDCRFLFYYTELDAILLVGEAPDCRSLFWGEREGGGREQRLISLLVLTDGCGCVATPHPPQQMFVIGLCWAMCACRRWPMWRSLQRHWPLRCPESRRDLQARRSSMRRCRWVLCLLLPLSLRFSLSSAVYLFFVMRPPHAGGALLPSSRRTSPHHPGEPPEHRYGPARALGQTIRSLLITATLFPF